MNHLLPAEKTEPKANTPVWNRQKGHSLTSCNAIQANPSAMTLKRIWQRVPPTNCDDGRMISNSENEERKLNALRLHPETKKGPERPPKHY
jgi:hypothetical protein